MNIDTQNEKDLLITNNKSMSINNLKENSILPLSNGHEIKIKKKKINNVTISRNYNEKIQ